MPPRIDHFNGTEQQYITFLEQQVITLRQHASHGLRDPAHIKDNGSLGHRAAADEDARVLQPSAAQHSPPPIEIPEMLQEARISNFQQNRSFRIIPWTPNKDHHVQKRHKGASSETFAPAWQQKANSLVEATPIATDWHRALTDAGISQAMDGWKAAVFLLDTAYSVPRSCVAEAQKQAEDSLTQHLRYYAESAQSRGLVASATLRLANFQHLLLLSSCAVLRDFQTVETPALYDIIRIVTGQKSERYCERLMDTAIYMNRLMDTLSTHGWGHRAAELILLWNRHPSFYYLLACSKESFTFLETKLTADRYKTTDDLNHRAPLFIPMLVNQILRREYPIDRISRVLGYKDAHILKIRGNAWQLQS